MQEQQGRETDSSSADMSDDPRLEGPVKLADLSVSPATEKALSLGTSVPGIAK